MSTNGTKLFKTPIRKGAPLAKSGVAEGLEAMARAIERLEVVGENDIKARIEWANGIPRIIIGREVTTT